MSNEFLLLWGWDMFIGLFVVAGIAVYMLIYVWICRKHLGLGIAFIALTSLGYITYTIAENQLERQEKSKVVSNL